VRFTLDSNILVYSLAEGSPHKREIAQDILLRALAADTFLTTQALGEFLNVIRRKYPHFIDQAINQARRWAQLFQMAETSTNHLLEGAEFARRYRLQLWDSILWRVAHSMGASVLLTEDLQDGLSIDGMTVIDPFRPENEIRLGRLLEASGDMI
jgi:predicted nucleic acid-binding protein